MFCQTFEARMLWMFAWIQYIRLCTTFNSKNTWEMLTERQRHYLLFVMLSLVAYCFFNCGPWEKCPSFVQGLLASTWISLTYRLPRTQWWEMVAIAIFKHIYNAPGTTTLAKIWCNMFAHKAAAGWSTRDSTWPQQREQLHSI